MSVTDAMRFWRSAAGFVRGCLVVALLATAPAADAGQVFSHIPVGALSGGGTFPTVETTNTSSDSTTGEHTITLPSGIASGDLIVVFIGITKSGNIDQDPTGFTEIYDVAGSGDISHSAFYKSAAGGETTVTFDSTAGGNFSSIHLSYRISGWSGAPEGATATGTSTSPDPPNLTPSWGSDDTLWLATLMADDGGAPDGTAPTNYTDYFEDETGPDGATARRELTASSEDPGTFTLGVSKEWIASTVAIQP